MNRKSIKRFAFILALLGCLATPFIYAYFTDMETLHNKITVGHNEIKVVEDYEPPKELIPGTCFKKKVTVKNTGTVPCYVRVFAEVTNSDIAQFLNIEFNTEKWTEKKSDGYYYYKEILPVGETTVPLFETVCVKSGADASKLKDFDILIYGESMQSEGYKDIEDAFDVKEEEQLGNVNITLDLVDITNVAYAPNKDMTFYFTLYEDEAMTIPKQGFECKKITIPSGSSTGNILLNDVPEGNYYISQCDEKGNVITSGEVGTDGMYSVLNTAKVTVTAGGTATAKITDQFLTLPTDY